MDIRNLIQQNHAAYTAYLIDDKATVRTLLNDRKLTILNDPSLNRLDLGYVNQRSMIMDLQIIDPVKFPNEDAAIDYAALFFQAITAQMDMYEALPTPNSNQKRRYGDLAIFRSAYMTSSVDFAYSANRKVINVDITTPWNAALTIPDDPADPDFLDKPLLFKLGYVMRSEAEESIGRQVVNQDIIDSQALDAAESADEAAQRAREIYSGDLGQRVSRAANIYNTKWLFDFNADPEVIWDEAKQTSEWALAWVNSE